MDWRIWRKINHKQNYKKQNINRTHNNPIFKQIAEIKQAFDEREEPKIIHFVDYGIILHCDKNDPYLWHSISLKVCPVHQTRVVRLKWIDSNTFDVTCAHPGCKQNIVDFVETNTAKRPKRRKR